MSKGPAGVRWGTAGGPRWSSRGGTSRARGRSRPAGPSPRRKTAATGECSASAPTRRAASSPESNDAPPPPDPDPSTRPAILK